MAKGYGWGDALIEGAAAADKSMNAKADREAAKQRGILTEQQIKAATAENTERDRKLGMEAGRRDAVSAPGAPQLGPDGQPVPPQAGPDGQPVPPKELRPFEIYSRAAKRRFDAGDVEGYEQFTNKSAALKTQYYTEELEKSFRKNDLAGGLALLNDFPDGVKYDIRRSDDGSLTGVAVSPDGKEQSMQFKSEKEAWSFISQRAKPGDIFGMLRQQAKDEVEAKKDAAEIELKGAQTGAAKATTVKTDAETGLVNARTAVETEFGAKEAKAKLGLIGAQTNAANRSSDNTPADLRTIDGLVKRGFTPEASVGLVFSKGGKNPDADAILAAQKELVGAYTDPIKRSQLSESEIVLAQRLLANAKPGAPKPGPGMNPGPSPAPAPANRVPLSSFNK